MTIMIHSVKWKLLLVCACLLPLNAAELDPRLAPLAATYQKQVGVLEESAAAEAKKAGQAYLAELKTSEDKATRSGDVKLLALLTKERSDVESGIALPVPDVELPKLVQAQHRTYYKAHEAAVEAMAKQRDQLNAKYLAALAKLQPAEGTDPVLAGQIDDQKKRLISGNFGPITNLQTQLGGTRWQSVNDAKHFEYFDPDGRFSHWKYTTPDPDTVVLHWNANSSISWKLGKDGKTLLKDGVPDLKLVPGAK